MKKILGWEVSEDIEMIDVYSIPQDISMDEILEARASELGTIIAADLFSMMLNPVNRGPNFKWDKLPKMVKGLAASQCVLYFSQKDITKHGEDIKNITTKSAEHMVNRLLENSNIKSTIPL